MIVYNKIVGDYRYWYWHSIKQMSPELAIDILYPIMLHDIKKSIPGLFRLCDDDKLANVEEVYNAARIVMEEYLPSKKKLEDNQGWKFYLKWKEEEVAEENKSRYCTHPKSTSSVRVEYYLRQAKKIINAKWNNPEFTKIRPKYLMKARIMLCQVLHLDPQSEECIRLMQNVMDGISA